MDERIEAILQDDDFWEEAGKRVADELARRKTARRAFRESPTFEAMLRSFLGAAEPRGFDSEELAYVPEQVLTRLSWDGAHTRDDVEKFLDVLANPDQTEVPEDARSTDETCPFCNSQFEFLGVNVSTMSGQGTIVGLSNGHREAVPSTRGQEEAPAS